MTGSVYQTVLFCSVCVIILKYALYNEDYVSLVGAVASWISHARIKDWIDMHAVW